MMALHPCKRLSGTTTQSCPTLAALTSKARSASLARTKHKPSRLQHLGLTTFDPTTFDTLGVRATSVNGTGAIKWVDTTPDTDQEPGETLGRIVYSVSGAANDLDVFAFTYDASASLPGGIAQITNTPYDELLSDLSEFAFRVR